MFEINYMSGNKRAFKDIESEKGKLGTQSRIYDCITGFFTRILTNDHKSFSFAESGIGFNGILNNNYRFYEVLGYTRRESMQLTSFITSKIDDMRGLTTDDINAIIQNGLLQFLSQRDVEFSSQPGVGTLLRAEQILMQFEKDGKIGYNEVLQGITASLEQEDLSDEDRKILEQLKSVYENDRFKKQRECDEIIQEEQSRSNISSPQATEKKHISTEITEGLEEKQNSGARAILEFMEKHNLTTQDLSLALAMAQATKTGVREAEGHIIDTKTRQNTPNRGEPNQIG